jgi:hypothetical protein
MQCDQLEQQVIDATSVGACTGASMMVNAQRTLV